MMESAIARKTDPWTSHQAAKEITESGLRESQREHVLLALKKHDGTTSSELAVFGCIDRYVTARRLPELEKLGFVKKGTAKKCTITGRNAMTWAVIPENERVETKSTDQLLAEHGCASIHDYEVGDYWIGYRNGYYTRHPKVCFVTGEPADDLHHTAYDHIFDEQDEFLVPLKRSIHELVEGLIKDFKMPRKIAHLVVQRIYDGTRNV
jgi:hypothetical protein